MKKLIVEKLKKKSITGLLVVIVVIVSVAVFAGCVEKEEVKPTLTTPIPTPTFIPAPTLTPLPTPIPTPTATPITVEKANLSILGVNFETECEQFKKECAINQVKLRIKNDGDKSSYIDLIDIEIIGDIPVPKEKPYVMTNQKVYDNTTGSTVEYVVYEYFPKETWKEFVRVYIDPTTNKPIKTELVYIEDISILPGEVKEIIKEVLNVELIKDKTYQMIAIARWPYTIYEINFTAG